MILYSFDPGRNTGYAVWNINNTNEFQLPISFGEVDYKHIFSFLDSLSEDEEEMMFIYEDYKIRNDPKSRGFNHQWNSGETLRVIGAIELRAFQLGITCVPQQPYIRRIGAGFAGMPHDVNKHDKDHISAMKHGYYYMVRNEMMKARGK